AETLAFYGPDARDAVDKLISLLCEKEMHQGIWSYSYPGGVELEIVRLQAIKALGAIGPDARDAVPTLIALRAFNIHVAVDAYAAPLADAAGTALKKIGPASVQSVPELISLFHYPEPYRYYPVVKFFLKGIGEEAVPVLVESLKHENSNIRSWAAVLLGEMGCGEEVSVPALVATLKSAHEQYIKSMAQFDPDEEAEKMALQCVEALKKIGPKAKDAIPLLRELADKDAPYYIRSDAQAALSTILHQLK
ncbi:MAG: HEAT repeat domain-containing protein, partial [Planctomycetaceae bacterium]|nr:HEAT repeat domain-containing protein [Planctomycetaceae bacterium]